MEELNLPGARTALHTTGYGRRLLAFVIDILVIFAFIGAPMNHLFQIDSFDFVITQTQATAIIILTILGIFYMTMMQYYYSQTLGMKLLGVSLKGDLKLSNCLYRAILMTPIFPFYLIWLVEPIFMITQNISLMDKMTGLELVREIHI